MANEENQFITITKDDGTEEKFVILLTYHSDKYNGDFLLAYKEDNDEGIYLFQYYEDNTLDIVEDPEMLKEAQEVLDRYDENNA